MTSYNTDGAVGPWAREKLEILRRYLEAYTTILRQYGFQDYYYVDAFAGEGKSELRRSKKDVSNDLLPLQIASYRSEDDDEVEFVSGSALVALGLKHPFKRYIFIEKNPVRVARLKSIAGTSPLGNRIMLREGDANVELVECLLNSGIDWNRNRGVVLLDPFGLQVPWSILQKLAQTKALEVIINFPVGTAIQRLLPRSGKFSDDQHNKLTQYLGSPDWEKVLYKEAPDLFGETIRAKISDSGDHLAKWYRNRLKKLFGHATMPRLITNQTGGHLYYLIHAGPKEVGVNIANDVLFKGRPIVR